MCHSFCALCPLILFRRFLSRYTKAAIFIFFSFGFHMLWLYTHSLTLAFAWTVTNTYIQAHAYYTHLTDRVCVTVQKVTLYMYNQNTHMIQNISYFIRFFFVGRFCFLRVYKDNCCWMISVGGFHCVWNIFQSQNINAINNTMKCIWNDDDSCDPEYKQWIYGDMIKINMIFSFIPK